MRSVAEKVKNKTGVRSWVRMRKTVSEQVWDQSWSVVSERVRLLVWEQVWNLTDDQITDHVRFRRLR